MQPSSPGEGEWPTSRENSIARSTIPPPQSLIKHPYTTRLLHPVWLYSIVALYMITLAFIADGGIVSDHIRLHIGQLPGYSCGSRHRPSHKPFWIPCRPLEAMGYTDDHRELHGFQKMFMGCSIEASARIARHLPNNKTRPGTSPHFGGMVH